MRDQDLGLVERHLQTGEVPTGDDIPTLFTVSDSGPPMTAADAGRHGAVPISQRFGRPRVPTDQAPVESFSGHVKTDWCHLEDIDDPEILAAELERVRL